MTSEPQAPTGQLTLHVVAGRSVGTELAIDADPLVLGRTQSGAAGLREDPELSREHARVQAFEDGRVLIEDLGSTNGTFINGGRAAGPTVLRDGDVIWMGTTTLIVKSPQSALPDVSPVEPPAPSAQGGFLARIADAAVARPKRLLAGLGIFFLFAVVLGGPVTKQLRDEGGFIDPAQESAKAEEAIAAASGTTPGVRTVVLFRTGRNVTDDPAVKREVLALERELKKSGDVADVVTFFDFNDKLFLTRDGKATYLAVKYKNVDQDAREEAAKELETKLEKPPRIVFGGQATVNKELRETVEKDLKRAEAVGFPLLILVSLLVFRSLVAAMLPIFVGIITIFSSFLVLRIIDSIGTVNVFALNVVTALGLGLAIDYSLFMVSRYREELAKVGEGRPKGELYGATEGAESFAGSKDEALRRTISTAGRTIMFSSVTVAIALLSLVVFPQPFLYSMGIGGAAAAIVAVIVSLIALPALLSILGPRINSLAPKRFQRAAYRTATQEKSGPWYRLAQAIMRRPLPIATLSALLMVVVGMSFTRIDFTGVNARILPQELEAKQVSNAFANSFPADPSAQVEVLIEAGPEAEAQVKKYATSLEKRDGVAAVFPPQKLNRQFWEVDLQPWVNGLDDDTVALVEDIRSRGSPDFSIQTAGETSEFIDQRESLRSKLPFAIVILALTTFIVLFLMTGSVILPLKSVIMNLLTLSFTLGLLVLIFQDGRLEGLLGFESGGAIDISQPILICAVAFGLSTDYAVFLLGRIAEARMHGASDNEAVAIGIERTGRIVTQAAILFCLAIGAFATSSVIFIKEVGVGTAAAVIIDSTIIRALLVPSLMAMLGGRNWWAPGPLRRLHNRIGLSEG